MDSQSIGSIAGASQATLASSQPAATRAANAAPVKSTKDAEADAKRADAAKAAKADTQVPQRDPRSLQYQVDGTTHRVVASIVDDGSKTVVRQVPDAEVLRIAKAIDRMQGFLVEERA